MASQGSKALDLKLTETAGATTSKPEVMTANTKPRSHATAAAGFPPSPPLSDTSDDSFRHSQLASSTGDFGRVDLGHGGAALSDITTPPTTPPAQRATSPGSSDGLDLAGERLLKKQLSNRPRGVADESLSTRLFQHFGAHDQWLRENFPEQYANGIHEFYDGSNITVSFYNAQKKRRGMDKKDHLPAFFSLPAFRDVLERGRLVERRFVAGSRNKMGVEPQYLLQARCLGFETKVFDRVRKFPASSDSEDEFRGMQMREQGVDELVLLGMAESLLDTKPGIMILATGDGNVGEFSSGFPSFVERALTRGWIVEVYSFAESAHSIWKDPSFINNPEWDGRLSFHPLDSFIHDFIDSNKDQLFHPAVSATVSRSSNKKSKMVKTIKTVNLSGGVPTPNTVPRQIASVVERPASTPAARPTQTSPVNPPAPIHSPQEVLTDGANGHFATYTQQFAQSYMASYPQYQNASQSYTSHYQQILGSYDYTAALARDTAMPVTSPSWF
ncbi:cell wall glucanase [Colletotrichum incanum]|nr:cell wall glucanase [Colletotrichum incanum]